MVNKKYGEASLGIVILSCDKYSDLWEPVINEFFNYWPDCPFPVYLSSNNKDCIDSRVITLKGGDDLDWSSSVIKSLENFYHTHVLFWMDDAFMSGKVDSTRVSQYFQYLLDNSLNYLRLRSVPKPAKKVNDNFWAINKDSAYRVSIFATLWPLQVFETIILPGETAWEFEENGTKRSACLEKFYSVDKDCFPHVHGVERSVWIRSAAKHLIRKGYNLDLNYRPMMTKFENYGKNYRVFKTWILHLLPEGWRKPVMSRIQTFYRFLKLR